MSSDNDQDNPLELLDSVPAGFDIEKLPKSFQKFLSDNSIDPQIYTVAKLPRYFRTNTHLPENKRPSLEDLKSQFKTDKVYAVDGLDNFFGVQLDDTTHRISDIPA